MIHKEGYLTIVITIIFIVILNSVIYFFGGNEIVKWIGYLLSVILFILIVQFFRNPHRRIILNEKNILAPADGKVVVIEEIFEEEYFHDRRIQISIFMSPFNVHTNRYPVSGKISYYKYHSGKYLVAWHPKSSTENERTTVCLANVASFSGESDKNTEILFRQIAGTLARRIVFYGKENEIVKQGEQCGFIKFGSRVDVILPLGTKVNVKLNDTVIGGKSVIAMFHAFK
ncbi:MAG: phosphatidylserine decarboxylase family protein [Bacteroidota bacterium]